MVFVLQFLLKTYFQNSHKDANGVWTYCFKFNIVIVHKIKIKYNKYFGYSIIFKF